MCVRVVVEWGWNKQYKQLAFSIGIIRDVACPSGHIDIFSHGLLLSGEVEGGVVVVNISTRLDNPKGDVCMGISPACR